MIKPEDLRIGDIVKVNEIGCALPKNAICKVASIRSKLYNTTERRFREGVELIDVNGFDEVCRDDGLCGLWCKSIDPIFLTLKLLRKNGFKEEQHQKEGTSEWYDFYHYDLGINIVYEVEEKESKFAVYLDGKKLREIQYVHELQHILWALGLNAELKV